MAEAKKTIMTDEEMFAQMEAKTPSEMKTSTANFLTMEDGKVENFKVEAVEPFEGDFGIQNSVVLKSKSGNKILALQAVIVSTIDEWIKAKTVTIPFMVRIEAGGTKVSKKGKEYQTFAIMAS